MAMRDEGHDAALTRALMMAGFGMMGAPNAWQGLARGGMFGMQGYDQALEMQDKRKLLEAKLREEALQAQQKEAALVRQQRLAGIIGGGAPVQPAGSQRSVVDAPGWTPQVAPAPARNVVQDLLAAGFVDEAKKYADAQKAGTDEVFSDVRMSEDGTPYLISKSGRPIPLPKNFALREKAHFADLGGRVVPLDPYSGAARGEGQAKGMSPAELDAKNRGWATFNRGTYDTDRGGFVTPGGFAAVPGMPGGKSAREDVDNLRKEFNNLPDVKNFRDVAPLFNAAAKAPDTPAGDFALIYGVGKILDPGSVVREGEMNMVMASGSPAQRVQGYLAHLQGNGRLTPQHRRELQEMLYNSAAERQALYDQARAAYEGVATKRGYNPADIFIAAPEMTRREGAPNTARGKIGKGPSVAEIEAELLRRKGGR
jgi:hypothetical protein